MSETKFPPQAIPMKDYHDRLDRRSFIKKIGALGATILGLGGAAAAANKDVQGAASEAAKALEEQAKRIVNSPSEIRDASYRDLQDTASGNSPSRVIPNNKVPPQK